MAKYSKLGKNEQKHLAQLAGCFVVIAGQPNHPMREVARWAIREILWRWTADGVKTSGFVRVDAIKYDAKVHPSTAAARRLFAKLGKKGLRHDHVVPRKMLADRMIEQNMDAQKILRFLRRFCHAAIVTTKEHDKLKPRDQMPLGWTWRDGDPFARYTCSSIRLRRPPAAKR